MRLILITILLFTSFTLNADPKFIKTGSRLINLDKVTLIKNNCGAWQSNILIRFNQGIGKSETMLQFDGSDTCIDAFSWFEKFLLEGKK